MNYTLQIRRKSQSELLIIAILVIFFCFGFLIELLRLPSVIKYSLDVLWLLLFATIIINKFRMPNAATRKLLRVAGIFMLVTLIGFVINGYTPLYYMWGFRNNFRFWIFFFSCAMFLKKETAEEILDLFHKLIYPNFIITLVQFFVLDKKMDYLGGIFGTEVGCNSKTLIFLFIMDAICILRFINGKKRISMCFVECGMSIVIAALAELKFYFIVFPLLIATSSLITKFSMKKLWIFVLTGLALYFGFSLLVMVFPQWRDDISLAAMLESASSADGYTGKGEFNRLTSIPLAMKQFLNNWFSRLFGLGLGHCDTSSFSFLNTPFYEKYGNLRYQWFLSSFIVLETGLLGLVSYVSFFISVFRYARTRERNNLGVSEWCQLTQVMIPFCLLLIIYNGSLRVEEAYMVYFVLALSFINVSSTEVLPKEKGNA